MLDDGYQNSKVRPFKEMKWPDKNNREDFEIKGFIEAYSRLPEARQFEIVTKGEAPDYFVKDAAIDKEFGVELTSVYIDDRSVPDKHMRGGKGEKSIPDIEKELEQYKVRLINTVKTKVDKARKGYNTTRPLILAIYMNEYISIYLDESEMEPFVQRYESVFDSIAPFSEIVFYRSPKDFIFRVRPDLKTS